MTSRHQFSWVMSMMMSGVCVHGVSAEQPNRTPKNIPQTRPEMKTVLEGLKQRTARLPLPELKPGEGNGDLRLIVNNGRMRNLYLPAEWTSTSWGGASRNAQSTTTGTASKLPSYAINEPGMTLDYAFKTRLFWLVSRLNNCLY